MDERARDLIHAKLDDELDEAGRAELELCLAASDEARREYEQLQALHEMLGGQPPYAVPPDLRPKVLAALPLPAVPVRPRRRQVARLGLVAALAATAAGVAILISRDDSFRELDPAVLAGTLGVPAAIRDAAALHINAEAVSGTIMLHRARDGLAIEVDLDAGRPVEIVATADAGVLELRGFVRVNGVPAGLEVEAGRLHVAHRGRQHYALVLGGDDQATAIAIAVFDGQRLIQETRLGVPGMRGGAEP